MAQTNYTPDLSVGTSAEPCSDSNVTAQKVCATIAVEDIEIGAVELKDATTDTRAKIKTDGTDNAVVVFQNNGSKETGGNLATVKTNTDPLVSSGAGGYVRQDSTATIAKETGGNLAAISTVQGATTDAAVSSDANGTISAKTRGIVKILADVWDSVTHALGVGGNVAHDGVDAGNPIKVGGKAVNPDSITAVSATGDRVDASYDTKGRAIVYLGTKLDSTNDTVDAAKIGGQTPSLNAGAAGAGTLRVVAASDSPEVTNTATIAGSVTSSRVAVNPIVGQAGVSANAGTTDATTLRVVTASDGPLNTNLGTTTDAAVITDTTGSLSSKIRGLVKHAYERMPAALGQTTSAASLPVVIASDQAKAAPSTASINDGYLTHTSTTAAATVLTVPTGKTWVGQVTVIAAISKAAAATGNGSANGLITVVNGTGTSTPATGTTIMEVEAKAGANAATGVVGTQGMMAYTMRVVVNASGGTALIKLASAIGSATDGKVSCMAIGENLTAVA